MSDYIRREDAIEAIGNFLSKEDDYFVDMAKGTIKLIPSADVAPVRHGRWIDDAGAQKCSVCGTSFSDLHPLYEEANYCGNCGARMDGDD